MPWFLLSYPLQSRPSTSQTFPLRLTKWLIRVSFWRHPVDDVRWSRLSLRDQFRIHTLLTQRHLVLLVIVHQALALQNAQEDRHGVFRQTLPRVGQESGVIERSQLLRRNVNRSASGSTVVCWSDCQSLLASQLVKALRLTRKFGPVDIRFVNAWELAKTFGHLGRADVLALPPERIA